ncbi:hypothetical protein DM02DRAFT_684260 [Periconia macrospinosa]|uniref:Uncharacterized protein n=1 Tax=Periconia macrospinosa TaxID=97972 RepID=A0A2V1E5E6_9PLEO|nr:hypothetical protein DM02DRAFT_684260 [Periconia macrospinosa]
MVIATYSAMLALVGSSLAMPHPQGPSYTSKSGPTFPTNMSCGEVNVFYTGFTAYHPYVLAQGLEGAEVDPRLRNGTANLIKAGYNVRVLFQGPEQPVSNVADRMKGTKWHVDAQGMGIRAYANATATRRFEDVLYQFQRSAPNAPTVFNWGPDSFAEAVIRRIPLKEDCKNKPGKLIAYEEICEPDVCEKVTVILDGDMEKLLEGIN